MLRLSRVHIARTHFQLLPRSFANAINQDSYALRTTSDFSVASLKKTEIVGELMVLSPMDSFVTPGRKRDVSKERKVVRSDDAVAGNTILKVYSQIPDQVFSQLKGLSSDDALCLGIFGYGTTALKTCVSLMRFSDQFEVKIGVDGSKHRSFFAHLTVPTISGDYVVRLFSKGTKENYSVRHVDPRTGELVDKDLESFENAEFSINRLTKCYHILATSPKFQVRGNFISELATVLSLAPNLPINTTLNKLMIRLESISKEKKLLCLLNGSAVGSKCIVNMSVNSAAQQELLQLNGETSKREVKAVDLSLLNLDEKKKVLQTLLLQSVEFVVHTADMLMCAQHEELWNKLQSRGSVNFTRKELINRYIKSDVAPLLHLTIQSMLDSPVLCDLLENSHSTTDKAASASASRVNASAPTVRRLDLNGLIAKIEDKSSSSSTSSATNTVGTGDVGLTVLRNVVDPQQLTRSSATVDGPTLLSRLRQLQADYHNPSRNFLPREEGVRSGFLVQKYGFVPDKFEALDAPAQRAVGKEMQRSVRLVLESLASPPEQYERRMQYVRELQEKLITAAQLPEDASFDIFGSSGNGFGTANSDIDIQCHWNYDESQLTNRKGVQLIGEALRSMDMRDVMVRDMARIPVVIFTDPITGLKCDIAVPPFKLALHNTELLRTYASIDSRVSSLGLLIKHWAKARQINSPSDRTLSSYTLMLMMIQFLQMLPVPLLPSLQKLPSNWNGWSTFATKRQCADVVLDSSKKCNIYFYKPETSQQEQLLKNFAARNTQSLQELLMSFFQFYGHQFSTRDQVVSVKNGSSLTRKDKSEDADWFVKPTLSVEDPFEIWFNTTHYIDAGSHQKILQEFVRGAALVNRLHLPGQPERSKYWSGKDTLPDTVEPEDFFRILCEKKTVETIPHSNYTHQQKQRGADTSLHKKHPLRPQQSHILKHHQRD